MQRGKGARLKKEKKRAQEMASGNGDWQDECECLKGTNVICELAQCSGLPITLLDMFRRHRKDREENFISAENKASTAPSSIPQLRARALSIRRKVEIGVFQ